MSVLGREHQGSIYMCMLQNLHVCACSLVPRPPLFLVLRFPFSIIHTEAEEREKRGRPGNTYHMNDMNDVRWT